MGKRKRAIMGILLPLLFSACLSFAQTLAISGDIPAPLTLTAEDIAAMPHVTAVIAQENGKPVRYEGVPLRDVLLKARAPFGGELRGKNLTTYILAKAHDGYQVIFTLAELDAQFAGESIFLVDKRGGGPLQEDQGPLRLMCPSDKAGARGVRMLESLEVVRLKK